MNTMLIGLAGPSGVGKTTFAEYLRAEHGFVHATGSGYLRRKEANRVLRSGKSVVFTAPAPDDLAWVEHKGGIVVSMIDVTGFDPGNPPKQGPVSGNLMFWRRFDDPAEARAQQVNAAKLLTQLYADVNRRRS